MMHSCQHAVLLALLCRGVFADNLEVLLPGEAQRSGPRPYHGGLVRREANTTGKAGFTSISTASSGDSNWRVMMPIEGTLFVVSLVFLLGLILLADATVLPMGEEPNVSHTTSMAGSWAIRLFGHMHIVLFHFYLVAPEDLQTTTVARMARFGVSWVPMFFVLSGFVAYLSGRNEVPSHAGSLAIAGRRYQRYYPMFALSFLVALINPHVREYMQTNLSMTVATGLLAMTWVYPYACPEINGPSWYLSNLIPLAMLSPLLSQKICRSKYPFTLMAWLFTATVLMNMLMDNMGEHPSEAVNLYAFSVFVHWPTFVAGMVAARLFGDHAATGSRPLWRFGVIFALVWIVTLFVFADFTDLPMRWLNYVFLPPSYCFLVVSMAFEQDYFMKLCARAPCAEWLVNTAWCVYILHMPLYNAFQRTVTRALGIRHPVALALLVLPVGAAASKLLDEPLQAWFAAARVPRRYQRSRTHSKT